MLHHLFPCQYAASLVPQTRPISLLIKYAHSRRVLVESVPDFAYIALMVPHGAEFRVRYIVGQLR